MTAATGAAASKKGVATAPLPFSAVLVIVTVEVAVTVVDSCVGALLMLMNTPPFIFMTVFASM